jgi:hypothetical protein
MNIIFRGASAVRICHDSDGPSSAWIDRAIKTIYETIDVENLEEAQIGGKPFNNRHLEIIGAINLDSWWLSKFFQLPVKHDLLHNYEIRVSRS